MILFRPRHKAMILNGTKTQTRRLWPHGKRVNVGSLQQARTKMLDAKSCFATLHIDRVWQEPLGKVSESDAKAEGYPSRDAYLHAFAEINRLSYAAAEPITVWCVAFHVESVPTP